MPELLIHALSTAGDGIGRLESGEVVFVTGALPGDRADIRLTRKIKKVQHAEVVEILEPSPQRVDSECRVAGCGGCAVRDLSREGQAAAKRERVVQTLQRIAKQDIDEMLGPLVQLGDGWRYRHRVRLHAAWEDDRWRLGYHARGTHRLVPLDTCPVLIPELEAAAISLDQAVAPLPKYGELQNVELVYSRTDGRAAARLQVAGSLTAFREPVEQPARKPLGGPLRPFLGQRADAPAPEYAPAAWFAASGLSGIEVVTADESWRHGDLELRYDHAHAGEFDLLAEPGVFTQGNPAVNDRLVDAVSRALPEDDFGRVLELHAGVGNFSLPLAQAGAVVFTAENMRSAVTLAQRNAEQAGVTLHAHFLTDIEALHGGGPVPPLSDFDAVLMNPPRVGAFNVAKKLAKSGPARIVYVSCDPATLARDVKEMAAGGYRITEATAFDMFPQTPHVEAVLVLDR